MDNDLEKMIAETEGVFRKMVDEGSDEGHSDLIEDLTNILKEARECQFHDFLNTKYEAPKVKLCTLLMGIISQTQDGKYDNHAN